MAIGSMTLACLLLAVGAGAPDEWHLNTRAFRIPIRIQPERRQEIRELRLWVSRNKGESWEQWATATPDKESFAFTAREDGAYWFSVAVVDGRGQQEPIDVSKAPVGQRIVVDTVKPEPRIVSAERQGDEVVVNWAAGEDNPDTATLKLEYRFTDTPDRPWMPAPLTPEQPQARFRPGGPGALAVRLSLKDRAGNEGISPPATVPPAANAIGGNATAVRPLFSDTNPVGTSAPSAMPAAAATPPPSAQASASAKHEGGFTPLDPGPTGAGRADTPPPPPPAITAATTSAGRSDAGALPPLKIINKKQVKLDFDVTRFGPSGLGSVEVYVTQDEGATWRPVMAEGGVSLPPASAVRGPVHGSVTVTVPDDGTVYGFYLVVKSKAGLGKPPPQKGEPPQLRVEADTTLPQAELYGPLPDPSKPGILVLTWKASDRNLAPTPITIEWAEQKAGPWSVIGDPELPNTGGTGGATGRFVWQVPEKMPPKVYLRLTVRDTAGNQAVAQTPEPILIDLMVPDVSGLRVGDAR